MAASAPARPHRPRRCPPPRWCDLGSSPGPSDSARARSKPALGWHKPHHTTRTCAQVQCRRLLYSYGLVFYLGRPLIQPILVKQRASPKRR
jgi:hypothetical protein